MNFEHSERSLAGNVLNGPRTRSGQLNDLSVLELFRSIEF